jgi:GNAT superfamily N-acetyltransferase
MIDLRRVEEIGLNALQTQRQLFYDGWILRLSPGKARRARSVNAHFGSTLPVAEKIRHCERVYEACGLPMLFRMTPFVHPGDLAQALDARGYAPFDPTLVQVARLDAPPDAQDDEAFAIASATPTAFADVLAGMQQSTPAQRDAYLERMVATPQATRHLVASLDGRPVAIGTAMMEDRTAGVFSMNTVPELRGRGAASALLARLLGWAWEHGASHAYLQVDAQNHPALALYRKFGFETAYTYHYWAREGEQS